MTKKESIPKSAVASSDKITFKGVYHTVLRHCGIWL